MSTLIEKNPPLSGHSEEEGKMIGVNPKNSVVSSISHHDTHFKSFQTFPKVKFDLGMLKKVKGSGGQYTALCPAHDDNTSSLSVKIAGGRVLLHCHAGCDVEAVMGALGLPLSALFLNDNPLPKKSKLAPRQVNTITYEYLNPDGAMAYKKIRYNYPDGTKSFAFFSPDGKKGVAGIARVPYNLPAVISANTVYFVEGEKAADALIKTGRVATSLDAGANSRWRPEYTAFFQGKNIVILPDNDAPGMNYAKSIASHIPGAEIKILPGLPEKGDIYDWLDMGHSVEELDELPFIDIECEEETESHDFFLPAEPGFIPINPFENKAAKNRYRWNDIGISNLFADCYKNVSRYVPETNSWYTYDGRTWRHDIGGVSVADQAKRFMYHLLITCQKFIEDDDTRAKWVDFVSKRMKKQARDTMIADAASCWPLSILAFDNNPFIFNCQNCTFNLKTFTAHNHSPDDFLSKVSGVIYDETARCERWEDFIGEIMQNDIETAAFLQKALGYTLTGDTSEECFFILYGSTTRNGKGTTMETILRLMGDYGRTAQPETIAQKQVTHSGAPSEDIARLKGARFVNMSEPDKGLKLNSALVKQVTGGDTVTARFLHQNSFEYRPEYKLFINTNHLPKIQDDTVFTGGRVMLIPFERHFQPNEQDKGLKEFFKQPQNISGIFNWLLEGLRLKQANGLHQPEAVTAATARYREEHDTIGQFIGECLINLPQHKIPVKEVHAAYETWCKEYGYSPFNNRNLVSELKKRGLNTERGTGNKVYISNYCLTSNDNPPNEWIN